MGETQIIFGLHTVRHALDHGAGRVRGLWIQEGKKPSRGLQAMLDQAGKLSIPVTVVSRDDLDRRTGHGRHQGVAAAYHADAADMPADLETLLAGGGDRDWLFLVLDGVQDPHNLGACVRTAAAAGADAVIVPRDRAAPMNATARKVASGAAETLPVLRVTNLARALRALREARVWIVGAAAGAETVLFDVDLSGPVALVMGGEGRGLRANIRKHCDHLAAVPLAGKVESLNVSVAAGIGLFEAVRQRGRQG